MTPSDPVAFLEQHAQNVGKVLGNLTSLELSLRAVLAKLKPPTTPSTYNLLGLQVGDEVPEDAFTDYAQLRKLIERYNSNVQPGERIDGKPIVALRDALAHGRVLTAVEGAPMRIIKFDEPTGGKVRVTYCAQMDDAWFTQQRQLVFDALKTVSLVGQRLGVMSALS